MRLFRSSPPTSADNLSPLPLRIMRSARFSPNVASALPIQHLFDRNRDLQVLVAGTLGSGSHPRRIASSVDQRQVGLWMARTESKAPPLGSSFRPARPPSADIMGPRQSDAAQLSSSSRYLARLGGQLSVYPGGGDCATPFFEDGPDAGFRRCLDVGYRSRHSPPSAPSDAAGSLETAAGPGPDGNRSPKPERGGGGR